MEKSTISNLKCYGKPPVAVKDVVSALILILGYETRIANVKEILETGFQSFRHITINIRTIMFINCNIHVPVLCYIVFRIGANARRYWVILVYC